MHNWQGDTHLHGTSSGSGFRSPPISATFSFFESPEVGWERVSLIVGQIGVDEFADSEFAFGRAQSQEDDVCVWGVKYSSVWRGSRGSHYINSAASPPVIVNGIASRVVCLRRSVIGPNASGDSGSWLCASVQARLPPPPYSLQPSIPPQRIMSTSQSLIEGLPIELLERIFLLTSARDIIRLSMVRMFAKVF